MKFLRSLRIHLNPIKFGIFVGGIALIAIGVGLNALGLEWATWLVLVGLVPAVYFTFPDWLGLFNLFEFDEVDEGDAESDDDRVA